MYPYLFQTTCLCPGCINGSAPPPFTPFTSFAQMHPPYWNNFFYVNCAPIATFPAYVPPEEHYVVDFMNLLWSFLNHLNIQQLTFANSHFVMNVMYESLVRLIPPKGFVHLVAKQFTMWGLVLEHFQKIFKGSGQTFYLYCVHPENDLDAECDDRFALRLCKEIAKSNANITLISNDKYVNRDEHQKYFSEAAKYFWNNQPSYEIKKLSRELDKNKESHCIFHFEISENDQHECIIAEKREH